MSLLHGYWIKMSRSSIERKILGTARTTIIFVVKEGLSGKIEISENRSHLAVTANIRCLLYIAPFIL